MSILLKTVKRVCVKDARVRAARALPTRPAARLGAALDVASIVSRR
ncbi:MAG: hypothetical protein HKL90_14755 [Elusimicrobia bacterium]|nr:hypothetical protein [Elusimicrobiota bacterium]